MRYPRAGCKSVMDFCFRSKMTKFFVQNKTASVYLSVSLQFPRHVTFSVLNTSSVTEIYLTFL